MTVTELKTNDGKARGTGSTYKVEMIVHSEDLKEDQNLNSVLNWYKATIHEVTQR